METFGELINLYGKERLAINPLILAWARKQFPLDRACCCCCWVPLRKLTTEWRHQKRECCFELAGFDSSSFSTTRVHSGNQNRLFLLFFLFFFSFLFHVWDNQDSIGTNRTGENNFGRETDDDSSFVFLLLSSLFRNWYWSRSSNHGHSMSTRKKNICRHIDQPSNLRSL